MLSLGNDHVCGKLDEQSIGWSGHYKTKIYIVLYIHNLSTSSYVYLILCQFLFFIDVCFHASIFVFLKGYLNYQLS